MPITSNVVIRISIHALLAESDDTSKDTIKTVVNFYPRSPCGERHTNTYYAILSVQFLSTLSLRRATTDMRQRLIEFRFLSTLSLRRATGCQRGPGIPDFYFYPRSPCGERQITMAPAAAPTPISIHALLAESDDLVGEMEDKRGPISIHALLAESDDGHASHVPFFQISIHALLAESDVYSITGKYELNIFLSTLSLRRATSTGTMAT